MRIVDLYSGAGGFSCGFSKVFPHAEHHAAEMWKPAANTWEKNFGGSINRGRVSEVIDNLPTEADIVIGGPPCQGFSTMNRTLKGANKLNDPRNSEWMQYLRVVERCRPKVFVIENVKRIETSGVAQQIFDAASKIGYNAIGHTLIAADFGAPTIRKRFIIVGMRDGGVWSPPIPTHIDPASMVEDDAYEMFVDGRPAWLTVRDAIGDLPNPPESEEGASDFLHVDRSTPQDKARWAVLPPDVEHPVLKWFQANRPDLVPPCKRKNIEGKTFMNTYSFMPWDKPSLTITCGFPEANNGRCGHPSKTRQMTYRECARLQSFPDDFEFTGSPKQIGKQIGNAVPPKLAEAIAVSIKGEFHR